MIREVLVDARRRLAAAAFEPDTREAILLLSRVLGVSEARILSHQEERLDPPTTRRFGRLLERRLTGEPIAYLFGIKEFYGRPFHVDRRVLIPRPETEHLVEMALELPLPGSPLVLDIGTGSGCLACTLGLELPASRIVATDISVGALAVAHRNRQALGLRGRLELIAADLAAALDLHAFDLIVSNPPYIGRRESTTLSPEIVEFEPRDALFAGSTGDAIFRRLFAELTGLLAKTWLLLEIGADQADLIRRLSAGSPWELLEIRPDYAGHPRTALLHRG
jgi:release factor glutamine methyltransferase